jgi:mannose-6-phosphate isomerase-like protein (cupin superfamily)
MNANERDTGMVLQNLATKVLPKDPDHIAPDGSEIRLLPDLAGGGLCHCTLPAGKTTQAVKHKTVEEIWCFIDGKGEVWRKRGNHEEVVAVEAGVSLTIPADTLFQFRNNGSEPLRFIIATMPPWPGPDEAVPVEGRWK